MQRARCPLWRAAFDLSAREIGGSEASGGSGRPLEGVADSFGMQAKLTMQDLEELLAPDDESAYDPGTLARWNARTRRRLRAVLASARCELATLVVVPRQAESVARPLSSPRLSSSKALEQAWDGRRDTVPRRIRPAGASLRTGGVV